MPDITHLKKYGSSDKLLAIIISNPYLKKEGDLIGKTQLLIWIDEQLDKSNELKNITRGDIFSLLSKLVKDKIFKDSVSEYYHNYIATTKYFDLKDGKLMVFPSPDEITIVNSNTESKKISKIIEKTPNESQIENKIFYEWYIDNFHLKKNEHNQIIDYLPQFLNLICKLLTLRKTDFTIKVLCSLALSYIVIEDDYYPDFRKDGYIDDMFVITYALKQIKDKNPDLLIKNWVYDEKILDLVEDIYMKIHTLVSDDMLSIIQVVGMDKYSLYNTEKIKKCLN